MGHANNLLSCYHLEPGQRLFMLSDLTGSWHGDLPYWGCITGKTQEQIRQQWQIPALLADAGLAVAAKDISNGGILGTLIMMLELSGCGATLDLNALPRPPGHSDLLRWLRAFQSFGFLLAVEPAKVSALIHYFQNSHLTCRPIGMITGDGKIRLDYAGVTAEFWDVREQALTDLGVH
jgi:selenophosphate synthetase-related protein